MTSRDPAVGTGGRPNLAAPADALDQPFDQDGLYGLRATLSAHAPGLAISQEQTEHLLIVAGELATNAIRHGGGVGRLRLWRHGAVLYCQVSDGGPGIADSGIGTTPPDQARAGGRGVWICRQLCLDLTIERAQPGPGAVVTAIIDLDDTAG
ncbi:ATP-binding protein [Solwaraspora sp. WMMB335]|uniref:ATP-binding protein n=1 Tax=Solwaraspora sp. WMMB335 TaxID=3404118 RepID=UPI003B92F35B